MCVISYIESPLVCKVKNKWIITLSQSCDIYIYSSLLSHYNIPLLSSHHTVSKLCLLHKIFNIILYFPTLLTYLFLNHPTLIALNLYDHFYHFKSIPFFCINITSWTKEKSVLPHVQK